MDNDSAFTAAANAHRDRFLQEFKDYGMLLNSMSTDEHFPSDLDVNSRIIRP